MSQNVKLPLPSDRTRVLNVGPMSVGQMTQLLSPKYRGEKGYRLLSDKIIPACTGIEQGEFDELLLGDGAAIFLGIRRASYGDEFDYKAACPHCQHESGYFVDLSQMDVKYLEPDDKGVRRTSGFKFEYNYHGKKLVYVHHLPKNSERKEAEKLAEQLGAQHDDIDFTATAMLAMNIDDIEGVTDGMDEISKRHAIMENIFNAPLDFLESFRNARVEVDCGFESSVEQKCVGCNRVFSFELPLLESFFSKDAMTLKKERLAKAAEASEKKTDEDSKARFAIS